MTRFRVALALFALGLAIPCALLVQRTLATAELEQTVRHRAVADRTYDELERVLFDFLVAEEDRPFEAYRFYERLGKDGDATGATRSPLSYPPTHPFVVGYFEIDPRGEIRLPLLPDPGRSAPSGWMLESDSGEALVRVRRVLEHALAEWERRVERTPALRARLQPAEMAGPAPESSESGAGRAPAKKESEAMRFAWQDSRLKGANESVGPATVLEEKSESEDSTAYDLLGKLNRALSDRAERKQKTQYAPIEALAIEPERERGTGQRELHAAADSPVDDLDESLGALGYVGDSDSALEVDELAGLAESALGEKSDSFDASDRSDPSDGLAEGAEVDALAEPVFAQGVTQAVRLSRPTTAAPDSFARPAPRASLAKDRTRAKTERVRIALDPMTSRATDPDHLILYRTVLVGEQGHRQGLVIDRAELGSWLRREIIDASQLSRTLDLRVTSAGERPASLDSRGPGGDFRFQHRFAEPFESLRGDLTISPLQGSAGTRTIYWLVALLVLACAIGFFALDRMVSIALEFAQRRSNFVAAVSHELRTPLTAIRMYSEMLRDKLVPDPAKQQEYYATMANEAERLSRLVENVLEFSRLENGQREVSPQIGDPTSLLRQTAETLAPHALESGLQIVFEADEGCPPVQYDRDAIVQMVFNLVDNAIKYAKKASVREIQIGYRKSAGGTELSVRDFGPGVSKASLRHIFEPFYRAEDELTRETKGTGIGLALVRELADCMGASVDAESPADGGFRIAVRLAAGAS